MLEALEAAGAYRATSFDAPRSSDEDSGDSLADSLGTTEDGFGLAEQRATLERLMAAITPREREVLRLRFAEDLTQAEIGERIGVSQMQVSRLIRQSLARLRTAGLAAERHLPGGTAEPSSGARSAILDVDGTLVDTNYQHALAWYRAFRQNDFIVPIWKIHRAIGMGGDQLVAHLIGEEEAEEHGDEHPRRREAALPGDDRGVRAARGRARPDRRPPRAREDGDPRELARRAARSSTTSTSSTPASSPTTGRCPTTSRRRSPRPTSSRPRSRRPAPTTR